MEACAGVGGITGGNEGIAIEGEIDPAVGEMMIGAGPSGEGFGMAGAAGLGCLGCRRG